MSSSTWARTSDYSARGAAVRSRRLPRFHDVNAKTPSFFVFLLVATGCGSAAMPSAAAPMSPSVSPELATYDSAPQSPMAQSAQAKVSQPTATTPTATAATGAKSITATDNGKKTADAQAADFLIMYNGDLSMAVDDGKVSETLDKIIDASESVGGHLAGRKDQGVSIRIPSARFREALGKIGALGEITHEAITAEDVSEEFHDAEVRLANMKATRARLQEFLAKSANMNDMLTLERELERVSMDIDRVEGRMRFLKEHVAYSTLNVMLMARPRSQAIVAGGNGKPTTVVASRRVMHLKAAWLDELGVPKLVDN